MLIGGLILVGLFIGLFWIAQGIFTILSYAAPVLFIIALIVNYRVVTGYGEWLWNTLKREPLMGIIYTALSFFGFPILAAYLLFKAITINRIEKMREEQSYRRPYGGMRLNETIEAEYEVLDEDEQDSVRREDLDDYERLFDSK